MPDVRTVVETYGEVLYAIPKMGEHHPLKCSFGRHWLTLIRSARTRTPVAVCCGACRRLFGPIHDVGVL